MLTEIHLYPALVQGENSSESIRSQILLANLRKEVDVLIVGRGGGSIEDLWAFNEMPVIDAIYHSEIPIITAIGHETDFTISDFVSDLRAPTPTAAAELATPNKIDLLSDIDQMKSEISYKVRQLFDHKKRDLLYLDERIDRVTPIQKLERLNLDLAKMKRDLDRAYMFILEDKKHHHEKWMQALKSPVERISSLIDRHNDLKDKLNRNLLSMIDKKAYVFQVLRTQLEGMNPLVLMDRGFAVIEKDKKVITSIHDVKKDDIIDIRLKDGRIQAIVDDKKEN